MKNTFKNTGRNCRKATWLIEKKQAGNITIREQLELKMHLAGCSMCRLFEQQSMVIDKLVHSLFHEPQRNALKPDDEFKKQLQDRIEGQITSG